MKKLLLIGGGGHCKSVIQGMKRNGVPIAGIIDLSERVGAVVLGVSVVGNDDDMIRFSTKEYQAIVTLGSVKDNSQRKNFYQRLISLGFEMARFVSDYAMVSGTVCIGNGSVVLDGAIVNADTQIGVNCIINSGSIIEHDGIIGNHVHIAPGVTISGNVKIGDLAFIGIGSVINQNVNIGEGAVIGAGAVVIDDVLPNSTVAGVPAKIIGGTKATDRKNTFIAQNQKFMNDIYFHPDYVSAYVSDYRAELFSYNYEREGRFFRNIAIKRLIDKIGNKIIEDEYYDLETPYGYGGYLTNTDDSKFIEEAIANYRQHCLDKRIVAEFVRFHPFNTFPVHFPKQMTQCVYDRDIVVVDLNKSKEDRWSTYSSTVRNILRRNGNNVQINEEDLSDSELVNRFIKMYRETMNRNGASPFYYFNNEYFYKLFKLDNARLLTARCNGNIICMSVFLLAQDNAYYHLSAVESSCLCANGNYFLLDHVFNLSKDCGCGFFILGGGRTNRKDDDLLQFKRKFSNLIAKFYIGGQIFNEVKYEEYAESSLKEFGCHDNNLFLKWRYSNLNVM